VNRLSSNASISALVGTRIFFGQVPAEYNDQLVIRFFGYDGRPVSAKVTKSTTDDLKVQIDVMGPDLDQVEELSELVREQLDQETFGDCHHCRLVRLLDDFDKEDGGYRIMQEFQLWQRV
jgi:hypothetical protein